MNTTIRTPDDDDIADDLFQRLQAQAKPFDDRTFWAVIERMLDIHEKEQAQREVVGLRNTQESLPQSWVSAPNLILAPAGHSNARKSLLRWLELSDWEWSLTLTQIEQLRDTLGEQRRFKCWAMNTTRRRTFEKMQPGDRVLFCLRGTHRFDLQARVQIKLESENFGNALWPEPPNKGSWGLIYFVDDVESVQIPKRRLLQELGYDSKDRLCGVRHVSAERLGPAIAGYGGDLEKMFQDFDRIKQ
jgi:hypothetical protein